jgi:zinc/manganese transport system ATP-binding protein
VGFVLLGYLNTWWVMSVAVAFEDYSLGYERNPAVMRLRTEIIEGSLTAVVGPNGAGKSTLLKGVVGSLPPLSGQMSFGAIQCKDISYLPQQSEVDRSFPISVRELVAMGLWREVGPFGVIGRSYNARITEALVAVGLDGFQKRAIGSLSGGQFQRALFARVLLQNSPLVLLDEPFSAIDAGTTADLIDVVKRWHGEGRTIMAVLHDIEAVRAHFPETLLLARELVAHGPTDEVLTAENQFRARQMCEACSGPPHTCTRQAS